MNKLIALLIISVVILSSGCVTNTGAQELTSVEIREYEGEKLDSLVTSFRNNSIKGPQYIDRATYTLEVTGLVSKNRSFTYDEVLSNHQNYKKVVTLNCVDGWSARILWEGVLMKDIINEAWALPSANTIIFYAYDGYNTSFPLSYFMENDILMAYKMNGIEISPEKGFPFQLIAEDKWGYKWIKWITKIELSNDPSYRGFWESRGYSNIGDLDKDFLN